MSKFTKQQLEYIAELSKISVGSSDEDYLLSNLNSILQFVEYIQSVKTEDIKPISQITGLSDVWREDIVKSCSISRSDLLSNAPATRDGYVVVKKVL